MISLDKNIIKLAHGSGGKEMIDLIKTFKIAYRGEWKNFDNDSATLNIGNNKNLVFTTDSFVINPIFFPGGNIGHVAFCGTINDLVMMGAKPLGLSLSFIIEEGLEKMDLMKIIASINQLSLKTKVPVVTGDTKVVERGKLDKIMINVSGIGIVEGDNLLTKDIKLGDKIIISGGLGEHAVALLSKRFNYETDLITDSKPLIKEMEAIKHLIKIAKDPTRGGLAAVVNEIAETNKIGIILDEENIPVKEEVQKVSDMLGLNLYELACEGRLICFASPDKADKVVRKLKKFNPDANIIGEIVKGNKVMVKTVIGKRILPHPTGRIVPRIC